MKKIFECLHNNYTEQNALELINEITNSEKSSENKSRRKAKKTLPKKKTSTSTKTTGQTISNDSHEENNSSSSKEDHPEQKEPLQNFVQTGYVASLVKNMIDTIIKDGPNANKYKSEEENLSKNEEPELVDPAENNIEALEDPKISNELTGNFALAFPRKESNHGEKSGRNGQKSKNKPKMLDKNFDIDKLTEMPKFTNSALIKNNSNRDNIKIEQVSERTIPSNKIRTIKEMKIETSNINHEIIQGAYDSKKVMVDGFSQTELKRITPKDSNIPNKSTNVNNAETQDINSQKKKNKKKKKDLYNNFKNEEAKVEPKSTTQSKNKPYPSSVTLNKKLSIDTKKMQSPESSCPSKAQNSYKHSNSTKVSQLDTSNFYTNDEESDYWGKRRHSGQNSLYKKSKFNQFPSIFNEQGYSSNRSYYPPDEYPYSPTYKANQTLSSSDESPLKKEIYNNYYIINSSVNINNLQNYSEKGPIPAENNNFNFYPMGSGAMPQFQSYNGYNGGYSNYYGTYYNHPSYTQTSAKEDNNFDIMARIKGDIYPFIFHYRLHNDILDYSEAVIKTVDCMKGVKNFIIEYLEKMIQKSISKWH